MHAQHQVLHKTPLTKELCLSGSVKSPPAEADHRTSIDFSGSNYAKTWAPLNKVCKLKEVASARSLFLSKAIWDSRANVLHG